MSTCPDCGQEVVQIDWMRSHGIELAERDDDGPWVLREPIGNAKLPWPMRARGLLDEDRYRQHRCSRRAKLDGSLTTIAAVYGEHGPRLNVNATELKGDVEKGDVVTLYDAAGNEVRADVVGVEFVAVPRMDTLRNPAAEERQMAMEPRAAGPGPQAP